MSKRLPSLVAALLFTFGLTSSAGAATILTFNFDDLNGVADFVGANLSATDFTPGSGLNNVSFAAGDARARHWNNSATAAEALTNGNYWSVILSADPGFEFSLSNISLDEVRQSDGPLMFQLWADGSLLGSAMSTSTSPITRSVSFALGPVTTAELRIIGWNAANSGSDANWVIDNVNVGGTVQRSSADETSALVPAPEPGSLVLLGSGMLALAGWARRRKKD